MSDRIHSLSVVLEQDIRDDDAEPIMNAIRMIKGVLSVDGKVADITSHMAEERAKRVLTDAILKIAREGLACHD